MTDEQVEKIIKQNMFLQMNLAGIRADFEEAQRKPFVGLTDDEIYDMYNEPRSDSEMLEFAREIEAALRSKNT